MKHIFCTIVAIAAFLLMNSAYAQDKKVTDTTATKKPHRSTSLSISNKGIKVITDTVYNTSTAAIDSTKAAIKEKKEKRRFITSFGLVDLGINVLQDNTNYNDPRVKAFLNVPANHQNKSLFDLRNGKSINVNVYPLMVKFAALKTHGQKIYVSTGLGLQLYNFRYETPLTYTKNPTGVIIDTVSFKKDKLAMDYLNIPLMFTFKTRFGKDNWLVYGAGITEGYRISSWTKQVSYEFGKVKSHDAYGLADFNTCLSAEFGVEGVIRFFASYQLTSLYTNGLDQHPVSFGLRFDGI